MHTHCTFNTEQPENKSNRRTRAPSPYGTTVETLHISIVFFNTNSFAVTLKEVLNESLIRAGVFKILVRRI